MVQWINVLRNNSFINPLRSSLLCKQTAAIALVQVGSYGRLAGCQADEMLLHLEILKVYAGQNLGNLMAFRKVQCHYSNTNTLQLVLLQNLHPNMGLEVHKLQAPLFFGSIPTIKYYRT